MWGGVPNVGTEIPTRSSRVSPFSKIGGMMSARGDINKALEKTGVVFRLLKIGGGRGEWRITKFVGGLAITNFLTVLRFMGVPPWANDNSAEDVKEHIMLVSKNTVVLVVIVNDKFVVLTKQHRPIFSRWIRETPRGWEQEEGGALEILRRKIPKLLGDATKGIKGVSHLDPVEPIVTLLRGVPEDTSLRTNLTSYYLVRTVCDIKSKPDQTLQAALQEQLRENSGDNMYKACVFTIEELDDNLTKLISQQNTDTNSGLIDAHSISVWTAFYFYRKNKVAVS